MLRCLFLILAALTARGSIIQVSGQGSFSSFVGEGQIFLEFSGSDGIHSVSVNADQHYCCNLQLSSNPTSLGQGDYGPTGDASIDDIFVSGGVSGRKFRFLIGGVGFLRITEFDNALQFDKVIAYQQIEGYISITSFTQQRPGLFSGTFNIVPTPEPSAFTLIAGGLILMGIRKALSP